VENPVLEAQLEPVAVLEAIRVQAALLLLALAVLEETEVSAQVMKEVTEGEEAAVLAVIVVTEVWVQPHRQAL
jgi:hypothetical protein